MKKFFKGLGIFFFALILFISSLSMLLLLPIKKAISKETVKDIIVEVNFESIVKDNADIEKEVKELFEPIYNEAKELGIDEEIILKLINSKEVKGLLGDVTGSIVDYVVNGKNQKIISPQEIEGLVSEAIDDINQSGLYTFKAEEKEQILQVVKDGATEFQDLIPDTETISDSLSPEFHEDIKLIRFIFSSQLVMYIALAIVISILGLLSLNFKSGKWLKHSALTILIASTVSTIVTITLSVLNNTIFEQTPFAIQIVRKLLNFSYLLSLSTFIIMLAILIGYHRFQKNGWQEIKD